MTPPWFFACCELKKREGWTYSALLQGKGDVWNWWDDITSKNPRPAILIFSRNREDDQVLLQIETLEKLIGKDAYNRRCATIGRGGRVYGLLTLSLFLSWIPAERFTPEVRFPV